MNTSLNAKYPYESSAFKRYTKRNVGGARFNRSSGRVNASGHRMVFDREKEYVALHFHCVRHHPNPQVCVATQHSTRGLAWCRATRPGVVFIPRLGKRKFGRFAGRDEKKLRHRPRRFGGRRSACAWIVMACEGYHRSDARTGGRNTSAWNVTRVLTAR